MTAPTPEMQGFEPGTGWQINNTAILGGPLVIQKVAREPGSIRWYLSQGADMRLLPTPPARRQRCGACVVAAKKRQLIYWREQGIAGFDIASEKEAILVALDGNLFRVPKFWLSDSEDALYFIREQYSPTWQELQAQLDQHRSAPLQKISQSLFVYSYRDNSCRAVKDFPGHVFEIVVDVRAGVFYTHSQQEIIISDLYSGKVREAIPEPGNVKFALIGDGRILVWNPSTNDASQLYSDGKRVTSTFAGMLPAYSPSEESCAFWGRDGALYLTGPSRDIAPVLSLNDFETDMWTSLQSPVWSPHGQQLSVLFSLSGETGQPGGRLLILDIPSHTMSIRAQDVLNYSWL